MNAIGIDFGTSFCSASYINPDTKRPEAVNFYETGDAKLPSIVFFPQRGNPQVGLAPLQQLENIAGQDENIRMQVLGATMVGLKRILNKDGRFLSYTHEQIISIILKKIKAEIEQQHLLPTIDEVVLTHPVVFSEWKKQMLVNAAKQAGFKSVQLLEEPIAAAISVVKNNRFPNCRGLLIYDFGGGTFDAAYIQIEKDGEMHIPVAPQGEAMCGGEDIDLALYRDWEKTVQQNLKRSIASHRGEIDMGFRYRCEKQKKMLTSQQSVPFTELLPIINGNLQQIGPRTISREYLNSLIEPIIDKTIAKVKLITDDIKANNLPLDAAILIGGSSRIPLVRTKLQTLLPNVRIEIVSATDTAVALGASYHLLSKINIDYNHSQQQKRLQSKSITNHFCIHCGKAVTSAQKFCMYCGHPNYSYRP